jgi:hypothetical protein
MELGIDSFAAAFTHDSRAVAPADRMRDLIEQIVRADQVGLDSFGSVSIIAASSSTLHPPSSWGRPPRAPSTSG